MGGRGAPGASPLDGGLAVYGNKGWSTYWKDRLAEGSGCAGTEELAFFRRGSRESSSHIVWARKGGLFGAVFYVPESAQVATPAR